MKKIRLIFNSSSIWHSDSLSTKFIWHDLNIPSSQRYVVAGGNGCRWVGSKLISWNCLSGVMYWALEAWFISSNQWPNLPRNFLQRFNLSFGGFWKRNASRSSWNGPTSSDSISIRLLSKTVDGTRSIVEDEYLINCENHGYMVILSIMTEKVVFFRKRAGKRQEWPTGQIKCLVLIILV